MQFSNFAVKFSAGANKKWKQRTWLIITFRANVCFSRKRMQPDAFVFLKKICNTILLVFIRDALFSSKKRKKKRFRFFKKKIFI